MSSVFNYFEKLNNSLIVFLEHPIIKYGFLILIVLQIIFIETISKNYLEIFDNSLFKIIYAFFIAYSACFDPIYAIALTTLMIISLQELHNRNAKSGINSLMSKPVKTFHMNTNDMSNTVSFKLPTPAVIPSTPTMPSNDILINDKLVYKLINKHSLQKTPNKNDLLTAEYNFYEDPVSKTLTDNLKEKNVMYDDNMFVTDNDLMNAQTNNLKNIDQNSSMKAFAGDVINIQGLPNGYNSNKYTNKL
jgi:hypothetical protein